MSSVCWRRRRHAYLAELVLFRLLLFGVCGLLLGGCGSNPNTPSTPTGLQSLTIKGPATLSIGQTAQLMAVMASGQDVANGAAWKSTDSSVGPISSTGLLTAKAAGTTTVTATFQTASGTLTVTVSPVLLSSTTITTCGNIVSPGNYVVTADLSQLPEFGPCLQVQASMVQVDCQQHQISTIYLSGVNNISITNCARGTFVNVNRSTNVTIAHNALLTVALTGGSNNQVLDNTIDGGYDGSRQQVGEDDGIVLIDEANDAIQRNTIRNVFDAGIEGVDAITNSSITDNTIVNAGVAGIASYWCTNWIGNTVSGNSVSNSSWLVDYYYAVGLGKCINLSTPGVFQNNRFIGNRFTNPIVLGGTGSLNFRFPTLPTGAVVGNLIQGNDLGAAPGPYTDPPSGFIDGGGNICAAGTSLFCGGFGSAATTAGVLFVGLLAALNLAALQKEGR